VARLMAYSQLTEEDRLVNSGPLEQMVQIAESLLPTDWPGIIIHVEGARLQNWGEPSG